MDGVARDIEEANLGVVGPGNFLLGVGTLGNFPFHVGLSRANPDLANQYIFQFDLLAPLDGQGRG